jgi:phosphoesterase RecJ-like protein
MPAEASAYADVARALLSADSVAICAHVDPDGDAIGSVLGLTRALRMAGVDAIPVLADDRDAPRTYAYLPGYEDFRRAADMVSPPTFVALDTPTVRRLGAAARFVGEAGTVVCVDHHPDNEGFCELSVVDDSAAAVGQMIWRMLPLLGVEPDAGLASCLYVALLTDTGRFQYSNSGPDVLRDAAAMVEAGAPIRETFLRIYESSSQAQLTIVARTLSRLTIAGGGRVAFSWISDEDLSETGAVPEETENLIDSIRTVRGVGVVFLVKAHPGECHVSLRSKGSDDVGSVARAFGGGGHVAAAGFTYAGDLDSLLPKLLAAIEGAGSR